MSNLNCLPTYIICQILFWSIHPPVTYIHKWKAALSLLAISHNWRSVAKKCIYKCAIVAVNGNTVRDFSDIKIQTNVGLIRDNDGCHMVRKLSLADYTRKEGKSESLAQLLNLLIFEKNITSAQIATALETMLPNINELTLKPGWSTSILQPLAADIVDQYSKQLRTFEYTGVVYASEQHVTLNLSRLYLNIHDHSSSLYSAFNPQTLKDIHIAFADSQFCWKYFAIDKCTQSLSFDNLESLTIENEDFNFGTQDYKAAPLNIHSNLTLSVSKLSYLSLSYISLKCEDLKYLMQPSLKQLKYTGDFNEALKICQHNISNLEMLRFSISLDDYDNQVQDYAEQSNKLFCKTNGPVVVHCTINMPNPSLDFKLVSWPYLTHLCLQDKLDIIAIIEAIPAMPRLVYLELQPYNFYPRDMKMTALYFVSLKHLYTKPFTSSIKEFAMTFSTKTTEEFRQAIQVLRLYLPKLEIIRLLE